MYVLASSEQFDSLDFYWVPGESIIVLLERVLPTMKSMKSVHFWNIPISSADAMTIYDLLRANQVAKLSVFSQDSRADVLSTLAGCFEGSESPIQYLRFGSYYDHLSEETFLSFCHALPDSSLEHLDLSQLEIQTNNRENVVNALVTAIVNTTSLTKLSVKYTPALPEDDLIQALKRTDAVKNYDLFVTRREWLLDQTLEFRRSCWWKDILSDGQVSLDDWPRILKNTLADTRETDDVPFAFVKDICDNLVQRLELIALMAGTHSYAT